MDMKLVSQRKIIQYMYMYMYLYMIHVAGGVETATPSIHTCTLYYMDKLKASKYVYMYMYM